jgi:hypothetical protein
MSDQTQPQPVGPSGDQPGPGKGGVPVWVFVVTILAIAALAAAGGWMIRNSQATAAQSQEALEASLAIQQQLRDQVSSLQAELDSAIASASVPPTVTTSAGTASAGTTSKPAPKTVKEFTFVKSMSESGGKFWMKADFAQFLTGSAAAAAATAHGDESPPPNDYYIVNDNAKIRTFPIKSGIKVKVYGFGGDGASTSRMIPLGQFFDLMPGGTSTQEPWKSAPYWIWVKSGVIAKIEQQYLP